jgi:tRNA pseudouridine38-40 synthase
LRNIKLTLEYDGTRFLGFQNQRQGRTVQSVLEEALQKLFQKRIKIVASGRTDSGVHAEGQVVNFTVDSKIPLWKIQRGVNRYLPEDVSIVRIEEVSKKFHAQRSAKWKTYEYRVLQSKAPSPLTRNRTYQYYYPLNLAKIRQASKLLQGRKDFRAFEGSGSRRKSAVRTIRKIEVKQQGNLVTFRLESNGFLYRMVRNIVGTLLEIGQGRQNTQELRKAMKLKQREILGPTAPPQGLYLKRVKY